LTDIPKVKRLAEGSNGHFSGKTIKRIKVDIGPLQSSSQKFTNYLFKM